MKLSLNLSASGFLDFANRFGSQKVEQVIINRSNFGLVFIMGYQNKV
jgi:hypothetical protein